MPLTPTTVALVGWMAAATAMAGLWTLQQRWRNANIVDVGWTVLVGALAIFAAVTGAGWWPRRLAIAVIVGAWSLRLASHLVTDRLLRHRAEDGRYQQLRHDWGARASTRFFAFFQAQALAALFFALPPFLASADDEPAFRLTEMIALAVWAAAFLGESIADHQLAAFKRVPAHRGRTCDVGLWGYSRHPNYFFEWLMWLAYALYALRSPWGLLALLCPAAMLYLLFKVTGIPATEAQALRSRGDEYRRYQRTTSVFIPWRHA